MLLLFMLGSASLSCGLQRLARGVVSLSMSVSISSEEKLWVGGMSCSEICGMMLRKRRGFEERIVCVGDVSGRVTWTGEEDGFGFKKGRTGFEEWCEDGA
jgi:hypothetical protein